MTQEDSLEETLSANFVGQVAIADDDHISLQAERRFAELND